MRHYMRNKATELTDRSFVQIDKMRLDKEWIDQPELVMNVTEVLAEAKLRLGELEAELKVAMADVAEETRARYDKITVDGVKDKVIRHPKVIKLTNMKLKAEYRVDLLRGAVSALDSRKKALEDLVQLEGRDYFSAPKAKGVDNKDRMDDARKRKIRRGG